MLFFAMKNVFKVSYIQFISNNTSYYTNYIFNDVSIDCKMVKATKVRGEIKQR